MPKPLMLFALGDTVPFRRKTNTYAETETILQTLDVWLIPQRLFRFISPHKSWPAVKLGYKVACFDATFFGIR